MSTKTQTTAGSITVLGRLSVTRGLSLFILLLLATPIVVGLTSHQAYLRTQLPDVGIDVDAHLGVEARDDRWSLVQQRDRVVALDGVPVRDPADWIAKALAHPTGELAVTFARGDRQFTVTARSTPLHWIDQGAVWARIATALALMVMGLLVFVARPGAAITWLMLVLAWDLGAFLLVKIGFWFDPRLVKVMNIYPWAIATAVGLHFLAFFPQRIEWFRVRPLRALWFYLPVVAAPFVHILGFESKASFIGTLYATLVTLVIIVVVGKQYRRIRQSKDARSRSQYRALFVGFVTGLVVPAAWNWLRIALDVWNSPWAAHYNALPLVLFVGVTSYAVVRHNALAIDRFTAAVVGYGITTILLGSAFAAALVGIPLLVGSESPVLLVATTALTFAGFAPAYRMIKRWVDRRFFREHASSSQIADAMRELVLSMQQSSREEAVTAAFTAAAIFKCDRVELWLRSADGKELELDHHEGIGKPWADPMSLAGALGQALATGISAGVQELSPRTLDTAAQEELWKHELAMIAPIMTHGMVAGFVGIGRKRSGRGYGIEELSFLTIIGAQLGTVLERTQGDTKLDRYHLERRIGTGGMAEVYLAWQLGPGGFERKVALKRPLPHVSEDPNAVASFLDEARLAAQLVHPNIAQVYDVGERSGSYYIVMEYVDGPSLRQVLREMGAKKVTMPVPLAVAITTAMLSALDYAHRVKDERGRELKLVHRDVSPRNILLNRSGQPKLVDFGIARAQFQLHVTRTGIVKGTLPYMSPEQASDLELDHRADLYSAAVVLYELLTGEVAFAKGPAGKRPKPASAVNAAVTPALDRVLRRAMEMNPDQRYATASELSEALIAAISPQTPADAAELVKFLLVVCPQQMSDEGRSTRPPAIEAEAEGDRTASEGTGDHTVAEGKAEAADKADAMRATADGGVQVEDDGRERTVAMGKRKVED